MAHLKLEKFKKKPSPSIVGSQKKGRGNFLQKEISWRRKKLSSKQKEAFFRELGILLGAGVQMAHALDILLGQFSNKKEARLYKKILDEIIEGAGLSAAMAMTNQFNNYDIYCIKIGEESGNIAEVLSQLGHYYQQNLHQKRLLYKALSYPILILSVSTLALVFLIGYLIPVFAGIYQRFDADLPWFTQQVIDFSAQFKDLFPFVFITLFIIISLAYWQRKHAKFRKLGSELLIRIPVLGALIQKNYLSRMAQAFYLLLSADVPLLKAVGLVEHMIGFYPIEQSMRTTKIQLEQGSHLYSSLEPYSIYDYKFIALVKIGEDVKQLDSMFEKIAEQYTEEVNHQSALLATLLEPVLILFLGLVVGVVLVAMYLPLFKLGGSM